MYVLTQHYLAYACYELVICGPFDYKHKIAPNHGL